jgi:hypothetical protein
MQTESVMCLECLEQLVTCHEILRMLISRISSKDHAVLCEQYVDCEFSVLLLLASPFSLVLMYCSRDVMLKISLV